MYITNSGIKNKLAAKGAIHHLKIQCIKHRNKNSLGVSLFPLFDVRISLLVIAVSVDRDLRHARCATTYILVRTRQYTYSYA